MPFSETHVYPDAYPRGFRVFEMKFKNTALIGCLYTKCTNCKYDVIIAEKQIKGLKERFYTSHFDHCCLQYV